MALQDKQPVVKGGWTHFVLHIRFDYNGEGRCGLQTVKIKVPYKSWIIKECWDLMTKNRHMIMPLLGITMAITPDRMLDYILTG